ncbi:MAG: 16S rRNA (uracil(1498)-N(3))-methyltransferase [Desulfitobacteriaceae bacterium]
MHRFKIGELGRDVFWLKDGEREHLVRVLRLAEGDQVIGFDNSGAEWLGEVEKIEDKSVTCRILTTQYPDVEAHSSVYLVAGLTKSEKMDWIIQKGTELGMAGLIPLRTKRAVMRLEGSKALERVERWQKIAAEAGKQSHRVRVPLIQNVSDWRELIDKLPAATQWLIPYEEEKAQPLSKVLADLDLNKPLAIIIGPEGGFDQAEVAYAQESLGAKSVTLGPRILRAETAALAALTMVLAAGGDLG